MRVTRKAFEQYLRESNVPYVAVDEAKKALFAGVDLPSFDFVVHSDAGPNWLTICKPFGKGDTRRTMEEWQKVFGSGFAAAEVRMRGGRFVLVTLDGQEKELPPAAAPAPASTTPPQRKAAWPEDCEARCAAALAAGRVRLKEAITLFDGRVHMPAGEIVTVVDVTPAAGALTIRNDKGTKATMLIEDCEPISVEAAPGGGVGTKPPSPEASHDQPTGPEPGTTAPKPHQKKERAVPKPKQAKKPAKGKAKKAAAPETYPVPIEKLRIDPDIQARADMNEDVVAEYAERMVAGVEFPAVLAFDDGETLWLADGFHRTPAAKLAGKTHILTEVRQGLRIDALWAAVGANANHGMRRTNADKARAVALALAARPDLSNRAIAEHVGVSDVMVSSHRHDLETSRSGAKVLHLDKRTGKDGKGYPAAKKPAEQPEPDLFPAGTRVAVIRGGLAGSAGTVLDLDVYAKKHATFHKPLTMPMGENLVIVQIDAREEPCWCQERDLRAVPAEPPATHYAPDDRVEIVDGDEKGALGTVQSEKLGDDNLVSVLLDDIDEPFWYEKAQLKRITIEIESDIPFETVEEPPAPDTTQVLDQVGNVLEPRVAEVYRRRDEITRMMSAVSDLKATVTKAVEAEDPLFVTINLSQFQADCGNLYRALRAAKPYAACPYCRQQGCDVCHARGFVGEFVYSQAPAEMKAGGPAAEAEGDDTPAPRKCAGCGADDAETLYECQECGLLYCPSCINTDTLVCAKCGEKK